MLRLALIIAAAHVLTACGGECLDGTLRYGDTCVAIDPFDKTPPIVTVSPGVYTREVGTVRLEANEPATIYYTIDGTTPSLDSPHENDTVVIPQVPDDAQLRYFAIDLNGNRSNEELRLWIIDREGPGPPTDFALAFTDPSRTVQWTPPPDPRFGGVMLARVEGAMSSPPVPGKQYAVGDELSPGVTIVRIDGPEVTSLTTYTESLTASPGLVRYAAWGFDDLYNYGAGAGAYIVVPLPPQAATAMVDAGAATFNVTAQASHVVVSGAATLTATTLTVDITIRNDTTRVLYAPKLVLTSTLPDGITWSDSDGMLDAAPYRAYGAAILPGSTKSATWTFEGASSATQLSLAVTIKDNPILYASYRNRITAGTIVDQVTGLAVLTLGAPQTGPGGNGMTNRGGFTPDGTLIVGAKTAGAVSMYELASGGRVLVSELREQKSQVPQIVLDQSATTAYAIVQEGHPNSLNNGNGTSKSELVRLDVASLTPSARLDIGIAKVRGMELSPDGKTLLIATGNTTQGVLVVDLLSFTITRKIMTDFRPQTATFVPGTIEGSSIAVIGERVALYGLDGTPAASFTTPGTSGKVSRAVFATPTTLWIGRRDELVTINTNDGTSQTFPGLDGRTLDVFDGKIYAGTNSLRKIALDGTVELNPIPGFTSIDGHWVGRSPF